MIKRIDHISIAVRDQKSALEFFTETLGAREVWSAPAPGFHWTLLELGDSCLLEIICPLGEQSFLEPFLASKAGGVHHMTLHVDNIEAMERHLAEHGVETFGKKEPVAGWKELFIHPKNAFGVLLQFAEFEPMDWVRPGEQVPGPYLGFARQKDQAILEQILSLGHPNLRRYSAPVDSVTDEITQQEGQKLSQMLAAVKKILGFGRAIAAPQMDIQKRILCVDVGQGPQLLFNPAITYKSKEQFTLWDDCLCFPDLLVRVQRHASISLSFIDQEGQQQHWENMKPQNSELLQHEIDHLDGTLAIDRAVDAQAIISRRAYHQNQDYFDSLVE